MKGVTGWQYRPYRPAYDEMPFDIYLCRLAPGKNTASLQWIGSNPAAESTVHYRLRHTEDEKILTVSSNTATLVDLNENCEYEVYVTCGDKKSLVRLFRTGEAIGTVINYLHPEDDIYAFMGHTYGSPTLVKLPSGALLAGMDVYSNGHPQNLEILFRSEDGGKTWHYVTELMPCFWGKLFLHRGSLYLIGSSTEYGDLLIGRSDDEGYTWTAPTVLFRGSCNSFFPGYITCPTPVVTANGRLWKALEYGDRRAYDQKNPHPHMPAVISIPEDADLLDASQWTLSTPLPYNPDWEGTAKGVCQGCLESNAVIGPDGELWVIPRYHTYNCEPNYGRLLLYKADKTEPEKQIVFYRAIDFNGNTSKFEIIKDEITGWYIAVVNGLDERNASCISSRNLVLMYKSRDLEHWEKVTVLFDLVDRPGEGTQNPSLVIDGEDLILTMRTAMNKPIGAMFANYATFHRIQNFRSLL